MLKNDYILLKFSYYALREKKITSHVVSLRKIHVGDGVSTCLGSWFIKIAAHLSIRYRLGHGGLSSRRNNLGSTERVTFA